MSDERRRAIDLIRREYGGSSNFMTPTVLAYGLLDDCTAYELSKGTGFLNEIIYGLSIAQERPDGTMSRRTDLSDCFHSRAAIDARIEELTGNVPEEEA